jgi:hypothetical protein
MLTVRYSTRLWNKQRYVGYLRNLAYTVTLCCCGAGFTSASAADVEQKPATVPPAVHQVGASTVRRLTQDQYRNIIADVFGADIKLGGRFEPDMRSDGLIAVGAGKASVTAAGLEQFDRMGRAIGAQVVDVRHRDTLIPCKPVSVESPDKDCAAMFLSQAGALLFRRPLSREELDAYVESSVLATRKTGDFYSGLALSLAGMLEAPQFLYRLEASEPDPGNPGVRRLTSYALAERLAFFLWDTAPDATLVSAAKSGEIQSTKGLIKQVDRMLASPRLESGVRAFFSDWLRFDSFDVLGKDSTLYPKFTFTVSQEAKEQTLRTVVDLLLKDHGDFRDLFVTRKTELTGRLGSVYGVSVVSKDGLFDAWVHYEFSPESGQSGILTQASFVALHSHPGRTSPTVRGKALREILLCQTVPDPPGNVNFALVQDTNNPNYKTVRERLTAHATEAMCKGCHKITDPIGLALENFDTIGGHRDRENGAEIDTNGELDGVKYHGAQGLGETMRNNPKVPACLVKNVYGYAVGRAPSKGEVAWLSGRIQPQFAAQGYHFPELLRVLATDDMFKTVAASEVPKPQSVTAAN